MRRPPSRPAFPPPAVAPVARAPGVVLGVVLGVALGTAACGAATLRPLLEVGEPAPEFLARDQTGTIRQWSLLRRDRWTILYFYPRDGTPGCTAEACAFRDAWDRLRAAGLRVVGVSTDDFESHARFAAEHELPFPLLSDPGGEVLARYGVPTVLGTLAARVTFLVAPDGRVARVYRDVDPAVHVDEILRDLAEIRGPQRSAAAPREVPPRDSGVRIRGASSEPNLRARVPSRAHSKG